MANVFVLGLGYTAKVPEEFIERLGRKIKVKTVTSIQACDTILVFCPIVSRVGTDIEAALKKIPDAGKPVILVVLHHTFDREYVVPDTRRYIHRADISSVDCLFTESEGLLTCVCNEESIATVADRLRRHSGGDFTCIMNDGGHNTTPLQRSLAHLNNLLTNPSYRLVGLPAVVLLLLFILFYFFVWP